MEKNNHDAKEFLLIEIESTALWRAQKALEYPVQEKINLNSRDKLLQLYDYVKKLPDDHNIFLWWFGTFSESFRQKIAAELRMFGYQNQSEFPEDFVYRLVNESINEGMVDDILDNRDIHGF